MLRSSTRSAIKIGKGGAGLDIEADIDYTIKDNLGLNLTDGLILCGRENWDGSCGNDHALDHYKETGYLLTLKLGTIAAGLEAAEELEAFKSMKRRRTNVLIKIKKETQKPTLRRGLTSFSLDPVHFGELVTPILISFRAIERILNSRLRDRGLIGNIIVDVPLKGLFSANVSQPIHITYEEYRRLIDDVMLFRNIPLQQSLV